MFGWKLCHNDIPLGEALKRRGFSIAKNYAFGCDNEEDKSHLLINRTISRSVWFGLGIGIHPDLIPLHDFNSWVLNIQDMTCQHAQAFLKENIIIFCWQIFTHRNKVLFENQTLIMQDVLCSFFYLANRISLENESKQEENRQTHIVNLTEKD